ncbi:MAG: galactarate dehydratase [Lachnospirales bacterium]
MKDVIMVNAIDNVAVVVKSGGLDIGVEVDKGIVTKTKVPQGHKVALKTFEINDPIIRYGEIIGYAKDVIQVGTHINEHMVILPQLTDIANFPFIEEKAVEVAESERTFMGYKNDDGSVGTKNLLGIITTVQCVEGVVNLAVKKANETLLSKYPNVDGIMALNHNYGCGVAINANNSEIPKRTLRNIAQNPNFSGNPIIVGLGCEKFMPHDLYSEADESNLIILQDEEGFNPMMNALLEMIEEKLVALNKRQREKCPISSLVVGLQCGGSDSFSGVSANPSLGYAADILVKAGATVLFSEVSEVRDGAHLLIPRCVNDKVARKFITQMLWFDDYLATGGTDRDANPTPGNKKGGLANIVEKALGSVAKSGTSNIVDVLEPGEKITRRGLIYAATPASDFVCGTLQLASGITTQVFTTGRGTPYGLKLAPVIKVSTNSDLKSKWDDLIDIDAGKILTGASTIEEVGLELFEYIIKVASGEVKTCADKYGIENAICLFNPAPIT